MKNLSKVASSIAVDSAESTRNQIQSTATTCSKENDTITIVEPSQVVNEIVEDILFLCGIEIYERDLQRKTIKFAAQITTDAMYESIHQVMLTSDELLPRIGTIFLVTDEAFKPPIPCEIDLSIRYSHIKRKLPQINVLPPESSENTPLSSVSESERRPSIADSTVVESSGTSAFNSKRHSNTFSTSSRPNSSSAIFPSGSKPSNKHPSPRKFREPKEDNIMSPELSAELLLREKSRKERENESKKYQQRPSGSSGIEGLSNTVFSDPFEMDKNVPKVEELMEKLEDSIRAQTANPLIDKIKIEFKLPIEQEEEVLPDIHMKDRPHQKNFTSNNNNKTTTTTSSSTRRLSPRKPESAYSTSSNNLKSLSMMLSPNVTSFLPEEQHKKFDFRDIVPEPGVKLQADTFCLKGPDVSPINSQMKKSMFYQDDKVLSALNGKVCHLISVGFCLDAVEAYLTQVWMNTSKQMSTQKLEEEEIHSHKQEQSCTAKDDAIRTTQATSPTRYKKPTNVSQRCNTTHCNKDHDHQMGAFFSAMIHKEEPGERPRSPRIRKPQSAYFMRVSDMKSPRARRSLQGTKSFQPRVRKDLE